MEVNKEIDDSMPNFLVTLERTVVQRVVIKITAESELDAKYKAIHQPTLIKDQKFFNIRVIHPREVTKVIEVP